MSIATDQWLLILTMAIVLLATRAGGLLLARYLPDSAGMRRTLDMLPGVVLVAVVLPDVVASGPMGMLASAVVYLIARLTSNLGIAIVAGVGLMALPG